MSVFVHWSSACQCSATRKGNNLHSAMRWIYRSEHPSAQAKMTRKHKYRQYFAIFDSPKSFPAFRTYQRCQLPLPHRSLPIARWRGALTPTFRPYYVLPQDTTLPDAQNSQVTENAPPSTIKPILFALRIGRPWVSLTAALGNILDLEYTMLGGRDLVFPRTAPGRHVTLAV